MIFFKLNIPSTMQQGLVEVRRSPCKLGIFILYLLFWIRHLYLTKSSNRHRSHRNYRTCKVVFDAIL